MSAFSTKKKKMMLYVYWIMDFQIRDKYLYYEFSGEVCLFQWLENRVCFCSATGNCLVVVNDRACCFFFSIQMKDVGVVMILPTPS